MSNDKPDLVSVKVSRDFLTWLKVEAAKKSVPMYELLETLVSRGRPKPWQKAGV